MDSKQTIRNNKYFLKKCQPVSYAKEKIFKIEQQIRFNRIKNHFTALLSAYLVAKINQLEFLHNRHRNTILCIVCVLNTCNMPDFFPTPIAICIY